MRFAVYCICVVLISGCKIIDPAEEIPAYIRANSVSFTAGQNQGSSSHAITDAWIYVDGELIGGFEIPCSVPVLKEGNHTVLVLPGIKQNGMSTMRAIYPFYQGWEANVNLIRGQKTEINPSFSYFPAILPLWNCDFGSVGDNFNATGHTPYPNVYSVQSGNEAFEGSSAKIVLNENESYFLGTSSDSFLLDQSHEMYLELNYKCDQPFTIGLRNCDVPGNSIIRWLSVSPSADWKKMYVRLNDALIGFPASAHYSIAIEMSNPSGASSSTVWLDNLKLVN